VIIKAVVQKYMDVAITWSNDKYAYQIKRLEKYSSELSARINEVQTEWMALAQKSIVDLQRAGAPLSGDGSGSPVVGRKGVTIDEYRQIRQRLFDTNLKLIETEALLKRRQDELRASEARVDPELLAQRRIQGALRKDPAVAALMKDVDELRRKTELTKSRANPSDPSLVHMARQLEDLKNELRDLTTRKSEELVLQQADADPSLRELNDQIDSLKFLKSIYEKLLPQLKVSNEQEKADEVRMALLREDLASFREMRSSVEKRIEQLKFDSQGEARINEIDPARANATPIKDNRRKLLALAPVVVLALVLTLFLCLELLSGRVAPSDEIVPGA
jgi:hypothetical protein